MFKATAIAPANIAFTKFYGKTDEKLRLPANSSISLCLSDVLTTTTVEFLPHLKRDEITLKDGLFSDQEKTRIVEHLARIRNLAKEKKLARVLTQNSFPKSSGIASSASGFAALTVAATAALGLSLTEKELSILARLASGSACRSIPDGFVKWVKGDKSSNSYAYSLFPPDYWQVFDLLVIVQKEQKEIATTVAHRLANSSPFFKQRIRQMEEKNALLEKTIAQKSFPLLGELAEKEALEMHAVMMTCASPVFYWTAGTVNVMRFVWELRKYGLSVFFTIDAGANVHLLCEEKNSRIILEKLGEVKGIEKIIINQPAVGTKLSNKHLF